MALKGLGFIDEIKWEGANTVGVHLIYAALDTTNPHDPEVYGGLDIDGLTPDATFDTTIAAALKDQLVTDGVTVEAGDTVRLMGTTLSTEQ